LTSDDESLPTAGKLQITHILKKMDRPGVLRLPAKRETALIVC